MSSLFIFILQIATLKIGRQTTTSPFATFRSNLLSSTAIQSTFWYLVSGWWFTEAYIWSSPNLGWITRGGHHTPDILNERPIFFRLYTSILALSYAGVHLYLGSSSLVIPVSRLPKTPTLDAQTQSTHPLPPISAQLQQKFGPALIRSASIAGAVLVVAPFINTFGLRKIFWQLHLALAKPFFNLSRANAAPIGHPPLGPSFLLQCLFAGFLLILTWELTSILFLTYANQEPTRNGLPLSASSRDPNGTLLNGLKAKRDVVKTFAFWELAIIAQKHKDRRKAIFEDIERPTGPVWSQMIEAGFKILRDVDVRILGPPPKTSQPSSANPAIKTLPHIVSELQSQSSIFQKRSKPGVEELLVASPLRQLGSSRQPWHPPIEKTAKVVETKLLEYVNPSGRGSSSGRPPQSLPEQWTTSLRKSPVGWFFVSTDAAKINATVLGSPNGNAAIIVDVIESITKMLIASLSEDTYGKATPTVPDAVRTFTRTLSIIEDYTAKLHPETRAQIEEVEIIVERLRAGLKELLAAFQLYLLDVGLGIAELNQAKRVVEASNPEVTEEAKSVEQPTRRQLFSGGEGQRTKSAGRQRAPNTQEGSKQRIEPSQRSSSNNVGGKQGMNGRGHQRREMEQVR